MELPLKTPLNIGMELEQTKFYIGLSQRFTAMSTAVFLVVIIGVTSLLPHATKNF
jgi:hypothetical protein